MSSALPSRNPTSPLPSAWLNAAFFLAQTMLALSISMPSTLSNRSASEMANRPEPQ